MYIGLTRGRRANILIGMIHIVIIMVVVITRNV